MEVRSLRLENTAPAACPLSICLRGELPLQYGYGFTGYVDEESLLAAPEAARRKQEPVKQLAGEIPRQRLRAD